MNEAQVRLFPVNLTPIIDIFNDKLRERALQNEDTVEVFIKGINIDYKTHVEAFSNLQNLKTDNMFDELRLYSLIEYMLSANGILDFMSYVHDHLIGQNAKKNGQSHIRAHNKIRYPLIDDLVYYEKHVKNMIELYPDYVDYETAKTFEDCIHFISKYCRFKAIQWPIDRASELTVKKKIFGVNTGL